MTFPRLFTKMRKYPQLPHSGSNTPPSPPLAPLPPPSCPPPLHKLSNNAYSINCQVQPSLVNTKTMNMKQMAKWLREIPSPAISPPPTPRQTRPTMMPPVYITTNFNCEDKIPTAPQHVNRKQKRYAHQLAHQLKGQYKPMSK
jgi:hypothetical protein